MGIVFIVGSFAIGLAAGLVFGLYVSRKHPLRINGDSADLEPAVYNHFKAAGARHGLTVVQYVLSRAVSAGPVTVTGDFQPAPAPRGDAA